MNTRDVDITTGCLRVLQALAGADSSVVAVLREHLKTILPSLSLLVAKAYASGRGRRWRRAKRVLTRVCVWGGGGSRVQRMHLSERRTFACARWSRSSPVARRSEIALETLELLEFVGGKGMAAEISYERQCQWRAWRIRH